MKEPHISCSFPSPILLCGINYRPDASAWSTICGDSCNVPCACRCRACVHDAFHAFFHDGHNNSYSACPTHHGDDEAVHRSHHSTTLPDEFPTREAHDSTRVCDSVYNICILRPYFSPNCGQFQETRPTLPQSFPH